MTQSFLLTDPSASIFDFDPYSPYCPYALLQLHGYHDALFAECEARKTAIDQDLAGAAAEFEHQHRLSILYTPPIENIYNGSSQNQQHAAALSSTGNQTSSLGSAWPASETSGLGSRQAEETSSDTWQLATVSPTVTVMAPRPSRSSTSSSSGRMTDPAGSGDNTPATALSTPSSASSGSRPKTKIQWDTHFPGIMPDGNILLFLLEDALLKDRDPCLPTFRLKKRVFDMAVAAWDGDEARKARFERPVLKKIGNTLLKRVDIELRKLRDRLGLPAFVDKKREHDNLVKWFKQYWPTRQPDWLTLTAKERRLCNRWL